MPDDEAVVRAVPVNPGDVVVVRFPKEWMAQDQRVESLLDLVREAFPNNEVLALGGGIEIAVMGRDGDHA